jgi:hypothetical protein
MLPQRRDNKPENRIGEKITDARCEDDGRNRLENAPTELLKVLRQSHMDIARRHPLSQTKVAKKGKDTILSPFLPAKNLV